MLIKNSLKLLLNNLNVVFKTIIYSLITVLLTYLLLTVFFSDLVGKVVANPSFQKIIEDIKLVWHSFLTGNLRQDVDFVAQFELFMDSVTLNIGNYILPLIGICIGFYLISVINNICSYTLTCMMNARMSTFERKGFLETLIANLKKSLPFEAWYTLLALLGFFASFFAGILFIVYTFSSLYLTSIIIGLWLFILLFSLYMTMTATLRPLSVSGTRFKDLFKNRYTRRDFWQVLATFTFSLILFSSLNVAMFITTLGAGLIISIPVTQLFFVLVQLVLLYSLEGKKYYLDFENIVTPNKIKQDVQNADFLNDVEI